MTFRNPQELTIFANFFANYEQQINEILSDDSSEILVIDSTYRFSSAILLPTDLFATNLAVNPITIAYSKINCRNLNLTEKEQYSMIGHEIGHIFDTTIRDEGDNLNRKINADVMAVQLGLKESLISGLIKIRDGEFAQALANRIQIRIAQLNQINQ